MSLPPTLKSAMTPFPHSIEREAPVKQALAMMEEHDVHHLPVTDGEHRLCGVITHRDILAALAARNKKRAHDAAFRVKDAFVEDVYVVDLEEPLDAVLLTMAERHIGSALVTRQGKLAGVFTANDACRAFGRYLQSNFPHPGGHEAA